MLLQSGMYLPEKPATQDKWHIFSPNVYSTLQWLYASQLLLNQKLFFVLWKLAWLFYPLWWPQVRLVPHVWQPNIQYPQTKSIADWRHNVATNQRKWWTLVQWPWITHLYISWCWKHHIKLCDNVKCIRIYNILQLKPSSRIKY